MLPIVAVRNGLLPALGANAELLFVFAGVVAVLLFQPIKRSIDRLTDSFLYRLTYDPDHLLSHLGAVMATTLDARVLASQLACELAEAMKLDLAAVAYNRCDSPEAMTVGCALSEGDVRRLLGLCRDGSVVVADDLEQGTTGALTLADCGIRVIAPLSMDGEVLGAIMLGAKRNGGMYTSEDLRFLEILAPEASIAMNNAHLFDEKNLRVRELTALNELAYALGANIELESVLDAAMEQLVAVTNADSGSIMLLDEDSGILGIAVSRGIPAHIVSSTHIAMGEGIAGWVAQHREALILVDDTDPRFRSDLHRDEIVSAISAPVVCKDTVIGVLNVNRRRSAELFTRENLEVVTSFAGQMAVVIENARLYRDLENTILGTIGALAAAVDAKDPYTFGHSNDVTSYAVSIATNMGLSESDVQTVRIAATLHD
ncbi:MAG: GAF domain-containing protein, partial [Actinomycetota bacterium]